MRMEDVLIFMLLLTNCISVIGWAVCYISSKALVFFMKEKGYTPPGKMEIKKWCRYAAKHTLRLCKNDMD